MSAYLLSIKLEKDAHIQKHYERCYGRIAGGLPNILHMESFFFKEINDLKLGQNHFADHPL